MAQSDLQFVNFEELWNLVNADNEEHNHMIVLQPDVYEKLKAIMEAEDLEEKLELISRYGAIISASITDRFYKVEVLDENTGSGESEIRDDDMGMEDTTGTEGGTTEPTTEPTEPTEPTTEPTEPTTEPTEPTTEPTEPTEPTTEPTEPTEPENGDNANVEGE